MLRLEAFLSLSCPIQTQQNMIQHISPLRLHREPSKLHHNEGVEAFAEQENATSEVDCISLGRCISISIDICSAAQHNVNKFVLKLCSPVRFFPRQKAALKRKMHT
jgi:hypothetical protein